MVIERDVIFYPVSNNEFFFLLTNTAFSYLKKKLLEVSEYVEMQHNMIMSL